MPEKLYNNKIIALLRKCIESPIYPVILGAVSLACYFLNLPITSIIIFGVVCTFTFLFVEDTRPALPAVLFVFLTLQYQFDIKPYQSVFAICVYAIGGTIALGSIVFHFCVYKLDHHKRELHWGFIALALAFFLGGLFGNHYDWRNLRNAVVFTASICAVYYFFTYTMRHREDNLLYVARVCVVAMFIIVAQIAEIYITEYDLGTALSLDWKGKVDLGWGLGNSAGEMMAMMLPALFYLIYKEKHGYLYNILLIIGVAAIYFTFCRCALLFTIPALAVGLTVNCIIGRYRKINALFVFLLLATIGGLVLSVFISGQQEKYFAYFIEKKLDDSSRFEIWREYLGFFKDSPVFGEGFAVYRRIHNDHLGPEYTGLKVLNAHNTVVQMLGCTGIVGFVLYLFHRVQTMWIIFKKPNVDRIFLGGCIIMGLLLSLLDPLFFRVYFLLFYGVLLMVIEKSYIADVEKDKAANTELIEAEKTE
ncbi:MAG: O-antigen ligase family protein [Clostridia bacterium]|nr:O-antigen ligase family protein [Clostridia bacterium]